MANPKSKIPIIRPRSEDTLLRKSKNNDKDITVIRQRAKSGNNEKKRSDKGKTKHSDDANLGNMIQSQDVRKDLNVGERKENETHKYFIPERKGRNKKTSFVVRIDRVGDKDVLVAEEIGQGWTESSENDKEQKEYTDNVLNNHTALNETEFTGKVDPYSGDSGDSFKETDSNFGPKLISDVSAASIDKQLSELSKTRSRIKGQATFDDEPKSTDIQVKNNVLTHANLRKLDQNKSNIIKRTNDIRLHTERSNTSRTWTPSSTNTQAVYLRSLKPDNSRHDNNRTQTDIFQVTAQDHSDIGRDHVPNRILSEITFIKDNSNGNFERIKSSESNFSHFSKAKRGNTFRVSSSSSRFRGSKSLGSMSEKLVERFEEVKSESIDNMNVDIKDNNEVNDNQETFQTKITKLSKRRIPVRKKLPPDYTNSPVIPSTSSSKTTEKNRVLETLNNHNAFESSASRLNSAEFINQDLKLVKRKVKNNVMTEFNKTNGKITLKKNLLSNVNKNKGKQVKNPVNEIFLGTGKHSAVVVLERASQYSQESETVDSHSYRGSKLYPLRVKDKRSGKGKHRATVKNVCTQTTWFIQPKIHRHKADTQKRKSKTLMYQSSHKSVQTWLMNSSVKSKEKANIDRYADENSPNKYRNVQQRLKKAPQPNKDKRRLSRFSDDVKKGEYLPLRRVSKQSEKKVDQKSNKNVDQLTGYEVS